jgi:DNA-binding SARP family transcriptional activator
LNAIATELRIWLLGGFRAEIGSQPVGDQAWRRSKAKALVKLLALTSGHRLHREQVLEALWPGLEPSAAGANLRKALHFARQALAPEHLRIRDEMVDLTAPRLWIDLEAFETAAAAGELSGAISLYGGDLLPEDRFEPWTEDRRERLREAFGGVLRQRARQLEASGEIRAATTALERLVAMDPLDEEAITELMRTHALAGQRHLALRWYRQLEERLAEELGVEPGPEARRLQQEIAAGHLQPVTEPAFAVPHHPSQAPEERKLVTAVLLDAAAPSADGDPERARLELDGSASLAAEVLESWGGVSDQLVSGTVLGVFGLPRTHEDDAFRALRAAQEILERSRLPVRIGVASGEVIAAAAPEFRAREIAGEPIETAGRLREAAEPSSILALDRTCRAAHGRFRFGEPVQVRVAGRPALTARHLLGLSGQARPDQARIQGPMIGREPELRMGLNLFEEVVENRQPRLLIVFGQAGVGKSRLVREAVDSIVGRSPGTTVLRGHCLSAGQDVTYWALGEILREACGISLTDPPAVAQAKLWENLQSRLGSMQGAGEIEATAFALAATAGITMPDSPLARLEPRAVADELARAWPRLVSAYASDAPLLVVVEDLHWAGEQMLEMLELMLARSTGPLLVIATARPDLAEIHPGFRPGPEAVASISLRPLGERHSSELLRWLAPGETGWKDLEGQVLAKAEGNPFFLEQIVLHLAGGGSGMLPDTLHSLLSARIDSLPPVEKKVLQQAAVVGRTFWEGPVQRTLGGKPAGEPLLNLERTGFVARRTASSLPAQAEFVFRHALIHDVAYESIPRARRGRLHAEVGGWLEELVGSRAEEFAELLAYHFTAAAAGEGSDLAWPEPLERERVRARAFEHLLRAGDSARRRFAVVRAEEMHERALALAASDLERLRALEEWGDDKAAVYRGEEAEGLYERALTLARAARARDADSARLCRKLAGLMAASPGAFSTSPDPSRAEALIAEGLSAAGDEVSRAWLLVVKGATARLYRGSEPFGQGAHRDPLPIEERIGAVLEALSTGEARNESALVEAANSALGLLYGIAGRYEEMTQLAEREMDGLTHARSRLDQADILRRVAVNRINIRARFEDALEPARRCYELSADSNPHQLMHATWALMASLYHLGRWDEVLTLLDEHLEAFRADPAVECQFVRDGPVIGATVLAHRGRLGEARELAGLVPNPVAEPESASAWQSLAAAALGDPESARAISAEKALEGRTYGPQHALALLEGLVALEDWAALAAFLPIARANSRGNALLGPFSDRAEGLLMAHRRRVREASRLLGRALQRFIEMSVPFEVARTRELLATVEPAQAAELLSAALETYERLGARPGEKAVRARLPGGRRGDADP